MGFGEPSFGGGFDFMFNLFPILFFIVFVVVIAAFVMNGVQIARNASAPRESVYAQVVAKRTEVSSHTSHRADGSGGLAPMSSSRTHYYITLEFDDGGRKEYLDVKNLYGLVTEGDRGYAAVKGDWIVAFERQQS